jgi:hypothetical protein
VNHSASVKLMPRLSGSLLVDGRRPAFDPRELAMLLALVAPILWTMRSSTEAAQRRAER